MTIGLPLPVPVRLPGRCTIIGHKKGTCIRPTVYLQDEGTQIEELSQVEPPRPWAWLTGWPGWYGAELLRTTHEPHFSHGRRDPCSFHAPAHADKCTVGISLRCAHPPIQAIFAAIHGLPSRASGILPKGKPPSVMATSCRPSLARAPRLADPGGHGLAGSEAP